ncbi:MAG: LysM peptidoglycan-binding domain-containing protein [Thermanaeromonas sp.]|uniref:cell wall hydrolase n=1 Tax=Thermanaeromonas sp. TaxID=2003697 RepID=UPI00243B3C48|nr:cell wall hydrolase [Thermanaeromonas sp.]MCG0277344.1 LysM peptidoglycan-binding domain-containing protein [Thermanaeromonas sp.]
MAIRYRERKILLFLACALAVCVFLFIRPATGYAATYTVQPGDTLYLIGLRYNVTPEEIQQANGLWDTWIYPGQVLWIPTKSGTTYTVQPGDTLFLIGLRFGVSYQEIMAANNLKSEYIYPGQVLWIPDRGSSSLASRGGRISYTPEEFELLARLVYAEARGEPYAGQVAVAAVVLNRVRDGRFPNTIAGVIYEPYAFESVYNGQIWLQPNATAYQAAREALAGKDPSGGALFFWNPATATSPWVWTRKIITVIGNHVFAI